MQLVVQEECFDTQLCLGLPDLHSMLFLRRRGCHFRVLVATLTSIRGPKHHVKPLAMLVKVTGTPGPSRCLEAELAWVQSKGPQDKGREGCVSCPKLRSSPATEGILGSWHLVLQGCGWSHRDTASALRPLRPFCRSLDASASIELQSLL